jgi:hypothetical protein
LDDPNNALDDHFNARYERCSAKDDTDDATKYFDAQATEHFNALARPSRPLSGIVRVLSEEWGGHLACQKVICVCRRGRQRFNQKSKSNPTLV